MSEPRTSVILQGAGAAKEGAFFARKGELSQVWSAIFSDVASVKVVTYYWGALRGLGLTLLRSSTGTHQKPRPPSQPSPACHPWIRTRLF